jgi:predicted deacylase
LLSHVPRAGIVRGLCQPGDDITSGDCIDQVHFVDKLEKSPCPVYTSHSGLLLCNRPPERVTRGDNIAIIAQELDCTKYDMDESNFIAGSGFRF